MGDRPVDARVARSRAKLRVALLDLVGEQQLDEITIADIAERAEVGYATFFRHYASKADLWHDITDGLSTELHARIGPLIDDPDPLTLSREFCLFVQSNRDALRAILGQGAAGTVRQDLISRSSSWVAMREPQSAYGLPWDLVLLHATSAYLSIVAWWLEHWESVSLEEMTGIIDRLVTRPLRRDAPTV